MHGPPVQAIRRKLDRLDQNYIWSGNNIGVGYMFEGRIDPERLRQSLAALLSEFPALSGRANFKHDRIDVASGGVPFLHVKDFPKQVQEFASVHHTISNRLDFVTEFSLKSITSGQAPLMAVKLTDFSGGGCVLGVTINHGLMDAAGFNHVMQRWSNIFTGAQSTPLRPNLTFPSFGTDRKIQAVLADIKAAEIDKPLKFKGLIGKSMKAIMFGGLEKIRRRGRERIYFSPGELARIKDAVHRESGLDWLSLHIALGAHILAAIAPLQLSPKARAVTIGNVVNIRNRLGPQPDRRFDDFVGNALYIMNTDLRADRPIAKLTRAQFAHHLRSAFDGLTPERITRDMRNITDSLNGGYGYPGLSIFKPIMALNNQMKMNIYGVDFGAGRLLRVIPHDVGDHVMIYPAPDDGAEVYIRDFASLKRQAQLRCPEWQARLRAIE